MQSLTTYLLSRRSLAERRRMPAFDPGFKPAELTLLAADDTTVTVSRRHLGRFPRKGMLYRTHTRGGLSGWTRVPEGNIAMPVELAAGDYVQLAVEDSAPDNLLNDARGMATFSLQSTGRIAGFGNVMSLIDRSCARSDVPEGCFRNLFSGCPIIRPPEMPAKQLAYRSYQGMYQFSGLLEAPELPAETMARECYRDLLSDCHDLRRADLSAVRKLADGCFLSMFRDSGIEVPPELPLTELAAGCYEFMFSGCGRLVRAPFLPAGNLMPHCYRQMFSSAPSLRIMEVGFDSWPAPTQVAEDYPTSGWISQGTSIVCDYALFRCPAGLPAEYFPRGDGKFGSGIPSWRREDL